MITVRQVFNKANQTVAVAASQVKPVVIGQFRRIDLVNYEAVSKDVIIEVEGVKLNARVVLKIYVKPSPQVRKQMISNRAYRGAAIGKHVLV